ncbi:MAG: ATP-binding protein [Vicingaceae bacterium]|jgi:two-component system, OmpR family, phosphate regulon sensor histidine kinase PhoR|nr:sensor histidine kinase [Flavobacteriales bacterium]MBQ19357.1 two-component sensor histidine kinase [Flavobacteriales bacterium]MDF1675591.1 ATP-binding protein [Vicingaceae bacterium]|tara:strand:- start:41282 stop:42328 length:1047 start_codon:yes stop_codon:yes gene_type:complete
MKELTPKGIAIRVAFLIATITVASLFIGLLFFDCNLPFYLFLLLFIITLLTSYFGFLYALEKFIYRKIKLIYRTIHNQKLKKDGEIEDLNFSDNIIQKVQQDVLDWAKTNQQEITRLKTSENYRREFVGNVSHELKTPIFNIQGYLLTLIEGGMDDPTINKDYLVKANNSVERMIDIIEDLDEITKLESGRLSMKIDKTDIVEIVKEVVDSLEERISKAGVTVKIQNQEKPIWVMADARKISQVLINLIINAIKYGKINGTIRIKFFDMHDNILIEVADDGEGIEAHHLPRLFERFYRTDKGRARENGGSGLGLSIVKHIVEAHKQTINVRSTVGVGSTFSFTLKKAK